MASMIPEDKIQGFAERVREAAGANLEAVILYGSAVSGEYHPENSNLNMFCVLRDSSFASLQALAPAVEWWSKQKQPPPMVMTRKELECSTDVFTIEWMDMQRHHRVLFGDDVVKDLVMDLRLHRVQVEYELREKLVLLRQTSLLGINNEKRLWEILLRSAPSFVTLFRHALIALGKPEPPTKREAIAALAKTAGCDASAFEQVLDVRAGKTEQKKIDVKELFARYLATVEKVTEAVDKALET